MPRVTWISCLLLLRCSTLFYQLLEALAYEYVSYKLFQLFSSLFNIHEIYICDSWSLVGFVWSKWNKVRGRKEIDRVVWEQQQISSKSFDGALLRLTLTYIGCLAKKESLRYSQSGMKRLLFSNNQRMRVFLYIFSINIHVCWIRKRELALTLVPLPFLSIEFFFKLFCRSNCSLPVTQKVASWLACHS